MTLSKMKVEQILSISKRQQDRLIKIIDILDKTNEWENIQRTFSEIVNSLRELDKKSCDAVLKAISNNLAVSLLNKGCDYKDIKIIEQIIYKHWNNIIETDVKLNIRDTYLKTLEEWKIYNSIIEERYIETTSKNHNILRVVSSLARIITGGGAIAFDTAKLHSIIPVPYFVYTSILSGAIYFCDGFDKLLKLD